MWWLMLLWLQNNANANTKKTIRKALSVILALFCKFFKKNFAYFGHVTGPGL